VKVLFFTGDGLAIFYRRLERGTFELPQAVDASVDAKGIELKLSELTLILEGIELSSVKHRRRWSRAPRLTADIFWLAGKVLGDFVRLISHGTGMFTRRLPPLAGAS
jgi:transposase